MAQNETRDSKRAILLEAGTNEVEFLKLSVAGQAFGVNVAKITQILLFNTLKLTALPTSDGCFLGTVEFRNHLIPIFDLRALLSIAVDDITNPQRLLLVAEFNQRTFGFIVDEVHNIERVSWDKFVASDEHALFHDDTSVIGSITIDDQIVMILDLEAMMSRVDSSMSVESCAPQLSAPGEIDRGKIRILYCEDSNVVRKATSRVLNEAGFTTLTLCTNGAEGLARLRAGGVEEFDIILSDIEMPTLDGLALCKTVKTDAALQRLPFIFFSSLISDQMVAKCKSVKGDAWFSKPQIQLVAAEIERLYLKSSRT